MVCLSCEKVVLVIVTAVLFLCCYVEKAILVIDIAAL